MSVDEGKKNRLLGCIERYGDARENVAKAKAAVLIEIEDAFAEPPPVVEVPKLRKQNYGPKTPAVAGHKPSGMERTLSAFRDAGMGVELLAEEVTKRAGLAGSTAFAYLAKLTSDGMLVRLRPGVYTLSEKGKATGS